MFERALPFGVGFAAIALSVLGLANAQTPAASSAGAPQTYRPGLGDLMTMTVQPRHIKLGLAGQEKNWTYAAYELHELEEAFERTAQVWPMYRKTNIAELMEASMKEPMEPCPRRSRAPTRPSSRKPMAGSQRPATPAM